MTMKNPKTKHYGIELTDIQLHTICPRKPKSWDKVIAKAMTTGESGRIYNRDITVTKEGIINLVLHGSPELKALKERQEKMGKIVHFLVPTDGLPVYYGNDLIDRLKIGSRLAM